jgi:Eukaryotic DNA topoisomerase I, DNA binding fragment
VFEFRYSTYLIDKPVDLPPESEEVAGFYGAMLETDHAKDATFNKNFFDDWSKVLKKHPPVCFTTMLFILPANSYTSATER